jgi:hypothetical protein
MTKTRTDALLFTVIMLSCLSIFSFPAEAYNTNTVSSISGGTSVKIVPGFINTLPCETVVGKIIISTGEPVTETFRIDIDGVPGDWIEYPESVDVENSKSVNFFLNPKESGDYRLVFRIIGSGGQVFESEERLWVARKQTAAGMQDGSLGAGSAADGSGVTGMFVFDDMGFAVMISTGIIIGIIITILLAYFFFKEEYEPDMW